MIRRAVFTTIAVIALFWGAAERAAAQQTPVVVELFTSQGCSSCPPADEFIGRIADRDDIIALSMHVDYWDYLGWRDIFGQSAHTQRQRAYAAYLGERMVYTPQIIVQGREGMVGSRIDQVEAAVARASAAPDKMNVSLTRKGERLLVTIDPIGAEVERCNVRLVWYSRAERVAITGGENRGRNIVYHNVVKGWADLGAWAGGEVKVGSPAPMMADGVAVLVQDVKRGYIVGAARLALN